MDQGKVGKMKKWFLLTCVFAFVGSLAVSAQTTMGGAQYWVYNYTNSIKRLDLKITSVKYSPDEFDQSSPLWTELLESYTTASDTLTGYLVVPVCFDCTGTADTSAPFSVGNAYDESFIYVIRKADKTKTVWKVTADVYAGLFNLGVGVRPLDEDDALSEMGYPTSKKKLTQAWMQVYFDFEDLADDALFNSTFGYLPYGFYGFGYEYIWLGHAGFGKAKTITTGGFCIPSGHCFVITSITSGRMAGYAYHKGVCGAPPIWDVCTLYPYPESATHGTWSLRLNEAMSSAFNGTLDDGGGLTGDSDDYMVGKLKGLALIDGANSAK